MDCCSEAFYLLKLQSWLEFFESISFWAELKEKEKSLWNFKWKRLFKNMFEIKHHSLYIKNMQK